MDPDPDQDQDLVYLPSRFTPRGVAAVETRPPASRTEIDSALLFLLFLLILLTRSRLSSADSNIAQAMNANLTRCPSLYYTQECSLSRGSRGSRAKADAEEY